MKIMRNINFKISFVLILIIGLGLSSCNLDEIPGPNNAGLDDIEKNATDGDIRTLISGTESLMRNDIGFYYDVSGIIGREYYFFTGSDPRYTGELLGKGESTLDKAGFYGTRPYAGRYRVIKNANILIAAVGNVTAFSDQEKNGIVGFAKTVQAYSYLLALNLQYQNGIRMDVSDPGNLGAFLSYTEALAAISSLLDDGNTMLSSAGDNFAFTLSTGFSDPVAFGKFNRAIAARVALYQDNKAGALSALNNSFMDLNGDFNDGPIHFFSLAGGDAINQVFRTPDQSEALVAHPSFITDLRPNDSRISKVAVRSGTAELDDLSGDYDVAIYSSQESAIKLIRNEELILIYAEANIGTNNAEAITALNIIRNAYGLGDYSGGMTDAELTDEVLYNRRYSLFGEGHRWIDMRRYNRLDQLPIDRTGDDVWEQMPRPVSEVGVQGG